MADSIELRASLNSLKRVDPYVNNILATATQVALYKFNVAQNTWEKADKEGALFLYSRNGEPFHSIMIFNRLNKDNFIEPIIKDFDYQVQLPFLLYRSKSKIFGIWFFNRDECTRVASLIESLMEKDKVSDRSMHQERFQNGQGNVDIFSMLSRAQEDFNRTPSKSEKNTASFSASTPRAPDMTSQSVMDFFAKASSKTVTQKPVSVGGNVQHQLQRLMSNPAHSVEHIEKQQRSITPQELISDSIKRNTACGPAYNMPSCMMAKDRFENQANGFSISSVSPPKEVLGSSPLAHVMHGQPLTTANPLMRPSAHSIQGQPVRRSPNSDEPVDLLGTSPFQQFLENAHKPLLMTPMMFTAPNPTKEIEVSSNTASTRSHTEAESVEMLTEKQLAQALIYLLKNNSDFIKQIHQAYTNSILEKVDKTKDKNSL